VGDLGIPKFGRIQRQLLAVAALSLTLVAAVLGLGGLAVSQLGVAHPSVGHAPATTAGVYRVVTPVPTPFAAPRPRVPSIHAAPSKTAAAPFPPPAATPRPAPAVRVVAKAAVKPSPKPRPRRRAARKRASRPAPVSQPTAAVAAVTAEPKATPVRTSPRMTRGNSGKPKVTGPSTRTPAAVRRPVQPQAWKAPKPKPVRAPKPRPAHAPKPVKPAPAPVAAPPAHGANGHGHGVGGTPPGAAKGHGKGR